MLYTASRFKKYPLLPDKWFLMTVSSYTSLSIRGRGNDSSENWGGRLKHN